MNLNMNISANVKGAVNSLNRLGDSVKKNSNQLNNFQKNQKKINNSLSNISKDANRASDGFKGMHSAFAGLNQMIGLGKFALLATGIKSTITASMEAIETANLFSVSMGELTEQTNATIQEMSALSGMDLTNLQSAVGTFALLARSMGMTSTQAQTLSVNTAKLGVDLSSLMNVPINQVMADLRSGLVGQSETVYKYGIDITEAGIAQEALAQGIDKSVRNMGQGEKMALRYAVMVKQSALAHGDFARTIDTPANQLRILKERFISLSRAIGNIFIPALSWILPYANAIVKVLIDVANAIASFFGFEPSAPKNMSTSMGGAMEDISDSVGGAGDSMDETAKKAKKMKQALMGFDEINTLPSQDDSDAGGGKGGKGGGGGLGDSILGDIKLPSYDNLFSGIKSKSAEIEERIRAIGRAFLELSKPIVTANWDILKNSVQGLWNAFKPLAGTIGAGLVWFYENAIVPLGVWFIEKGLPAVIDTVAQAFKTLNDVLVAFAPDSKERIEGFTIPIMSFVGDVFIGFLEGIQSGLRWFGDWVTNNTDAIVDLIDFLTIFFGLWKVTEMLGFIQMSGGVVNALKAITLATTGATMAKLRDKAETIYLTGLYAKDFLMSIVNSTGALLKQIGQFALLTGAKALDAIKTVALTVATNAMKVAQMALNLIMSLNPISLVIIAIGALVAGFVLAYNKSEKFRNAVNSLWTSITGIVTKGANSALAKMESFINGAIDGINKIILAWNEAKSAMGISGWTYPIAHVKLPRLARGGSLQTGQFFEAGEFGKAEMIGDYNGKTTVMPLENTSFVGAMGDAVYSAVTKAMVSNGGSGSGGSGDVILQVGSTEFGRVAISAINSVTRQEGKLSLEI